MFFEQDPIDLIKLQEWLSVVESQLAEIHNRNRRVESDRRGKPAVFGSYPSPGLLM
jgi:hypothetical protein